MQLCCVLEQGGSYLGSWETWNQVVVGGACLNAWDDCGSSGLLNMAHLTVWSLGAALHGMDANHFDLPPSTRCQIMWNVEVLKSLGTFGFECFS